MKCPANLRCVLIYAIFLFTVDLSAHDSVKLNPHVEALRSSNGPPLRVSAEDIPPPDEEYTIAEITPFALFSQAEAEQVVIYLNNRKIFVRHYEFHKVLHAIKLTLNYGFFSSDMTFLIIRDLIQLNLQAELVLINLSTYIIRTQIHYPNWANRIQNDFYFYLWLILDVYAKLGPNLSDIFERLNCFPCYQSIPNLQTLYESLYKLPRLKHHLMDILEACHEQGYGEETMYMWHLRDIMVAMIPFHPTTRRTLDFK